MRHMIEVSSPKKAAAHKYEARVQGLGLKLQYERLRQAQCFARRASLHLENGGCS